MAKRSKQADHASRKKPGPDAAQEPASEQRPLVFPAHPPRKNRALLIVSIVLFALWLTFLLYSALRGPP